MDLTNAALTLDRRQTTVFCFCQGMKQTIKFLQDQLTLQTLQTQQDYNDLHSSSKDVEIPALSLEEGVNR